MTIIDKIAWIRLENGAILTVRSRGKDVYYIPGAKREPGEGDIETLVREIKEELSVTIAPAAPSTSEPSTPKRRTPRRDDGPHDLLNRRLPRRPAS